jgi:hypothetical protein
VIRVRLEPYDRKCKSAFYQASLTIFFSLLVLLVFRSHPPAYGFPKELPMQATVSDLASDPKQYDGHRVVVTGRVRSMQMQVGRRGSEYLMIVLEEDSPTSSGKVKPVQVYISTLPKVREGDRALVQGVYHIEGKQAGRNFEHFVDAEVILKN